MSSSEPEKEEKPPVNETVVPSIIPRLTKPDKAEQDAKLNELNADIKTLQDRSVEIRAELDRLQNNRTGYGDQIQAAKSEYALAREKKDALLQERNEINAQIRQAADKKEKLQSSQRSSRSNLKFNTKEEIDREISRLCHLQETRSMTLTEEKRLIKDIEALKQSKEHLAKFSEQRDTVEKQNEMIKALKSKQTAKNAEIDLVSTEMKQQKEELDKLYALNAAEQQHDKYSELLNKRKEIRTELNKKFQAIRDLRDAYKEALDKFNENLRAIREKKRLERQLEEERLKAEYDEKLATYEEEMAKLHPYQDELDLCDALISFFQKNFSKELTVAENENTDQLCADVLEMDGMKPLQRKTEHFMVLGKKKGKRDGNGKKGRKDHRKLAMPIAQIESLSSIDILPPSKMSEVPETFAAIKEKRAWFTKQEQKPKVDSDATKVTADSNNVSAKQSRRKIDSKDHAAFPSLPETALKAEVVQETEEEIAA